LKFLPKEGLLCVASYANEGRIPLGEMSCSWWIRALGKAGKSIIRKNSLVRIADTSAVGIFENDKAGMWPLTFAKSFKTCSFIGIPEMNLELDAEPGDQVAQMRLAN